MAEFHQQNESIECLKCEIIARKFVPSMPINDPVLGKGIKYDLSRNATAMILEELNPKTPVKRELSNLNINDLLRAESITAFICSIKRQKFELLNESGRHKASRTVVGAFAYAQIKYPLKNVINAIAAQKLLFDKKNLIS
jgi:hypothetical protein